MKALRTTVSEPLGSGRLSLGVLIEEPSYKAATATLLIVHVQTLLTVIIIRLISHGSHLNKY